MKRLHITLLAAAASCIALSPATALETTSSGSIQTEASWSALKSMVDNANSRITVLQTALTACSRNGKLYAPGADTADAGGCIAIPAGITGTDLTQMQTHGPNFSPHPHGHILARWTANAQNITCPSDTVMVGLVVRTSGTCQHQCDIDGPIIQSLSIKCAPLK